MDISNEIDKHRDRLGISVHTIHIQAFDMDYVDDNDEIIEGFVTQYSTPFQHTMYAIYYHKSLSDEQLKVLIAHEMKHIEQMINGRLFVSLDGFRWEDKFYRHDEFEAGQQPHEIEANKYCEVR